MTDVQISPVQPTLDTLIGAAYVDPDYSDAYLVTPSDGHSVEDFAIAFFTSQPRWLAKVSMNLGDQTAVHRALADTNNFAEGSRVGSWRVHGRTDDEIMFGEHMGFMEYRFSMLRRADGQIEAATSVRYLKRLGNLYFVVVKPFHLGFVRLALRNAASQAAIAVQR